MSIAAVAPPAAYAADPVAGALTAGDSLFPNQGNGGYDAVHYDVNLAINVAVSTTNAAVSNSTVPAATSTMTAQTTGAPLSSFGMDFQGSTGNLAASTLNVDSVSVNGAPASFTRIENTTTADATTDVHKLVVTPATPVDGTFTTVVTYHGTPVRHTDTDGSAEGWNNTTDGATFVNQPVGSMTLIPGNDTPHDKATYTMTVDAPTTLNTSNYSQGGNAHAAAVVSNGELISKTPSSDGTRTTWVWDETKPMASELSLISLGRYDMYSSNIALASGRTIPEWSFLDPATSVANQTTTLSTRAQMKSLLDFYESKYGPYPGKSFGLLTDVVPSAINYALETQDRPFFPNSVSRGTFYHETMHQYWGDSVAPTDWNDITLNEGPATYAESQVPYESSGASTTTTEQSIFNSWNTTAATSSTFTIPAAAMTKASQLFGSQVYAKGAMTLEALRTVIGAANFETVMRQYQLTYGGGQITGRRTAAFEALAESISGRDLTAFFQSWWFSSTKPAWPFRHTLNLAGPTTTTNPGDAINYTVSIRNTGKVAMTAGQAVITVDLTDVLDDATIGTLPDNTTLSGTTLTWSVPATALAATSSIAIPFTVNSGTTGNTLAATTRATTLGSTCLECTQSAAVGTAPISPSPVPTITGGTPTVGVPLTADTSGWASGTSFTYQWLIDGNPVPGATTATYTPDGNAVGLPVTVRVTGTLSGFNPTTRISAATANALRGTLGSDTPTISGTPKIGVPLTVSPGAWDPGTYFTYQWLANNASIGGATGPTYTPALSTQVGQTITVTVTGTKFGYTTLAKTSAATAAVAAGDPQTLTPTPTLSGTPIIGAAYIPTIGQFDDGTTLTFQWAANGNNISGATGPTFTPTTTQAGQTLTLTVTSAKAGVANVTRTSAASPAVIQAPVTNVIARAGDGHVLVSFTPAAVGSAATSFLLTQTQGNNVGTTYTAAAGTTSKDITGLTNGVTYAFSVQAVNGAVQSPAATSSAVAPRVVAGEFTPVNPARILDTRVASGVTGGKPVGEGAANELTIPVLGQGGVPTTGVTAVVLNLTGVSASQATYITALTNPGPAYTSNLNFNDSGAKAVQVTVPVASDGTISLFNAQGTIDMIADVQGYYQDGTGFVAGRVHPQSPQRLLDTRSGLGVDGGTPGQVGDGKFIDVQVTGNAGVPAGATAVVMNLTGVSPTQATYLRAFSPTGVDAGTSAVNLTAGNVVANLVTVPLSAAGKVRLLNASGGIDIIADVLGYVSPSTDKTGSRYVATGTQRVLDTRVGPGPIGRVGPGQTVETGVNAPDGATGALIGVTSVLPSQATYLTVNPAGGTSYTSTLNSRGDEVVSNATMTLLDSDGQVTKGIGVTNAQGTDDILVDVQGYLAP